MTREGQGIGPEETPPHRATTRWSEPGAGQDADLLPPFVPRRRERPADSAADTTDVSSETREAVADTAEPEPMLEPAPDAGAFPFDETDTSFAADPALEMAGRLETLADRLRSEGVRGVQAELESPDRIIALLAGLIAGYLTGREG